MKVIQKWLCMAVSTILFIQIFSTTGWAADVSMDQFKYVEQGYNYGRGASEAPNGATVGWGEAYLLDGYMDMYEASNRKDWLDRIVDQSDRVLANAVDPDGDGNKGWPEALVAHFQTKNKDFTLVGANPSSAELINNGTFESDANLDQIPDSWTVQGNASKVYRSTATGDSFQGTAGVIVESDGTNANRLVQNISYTPGKRYVVEAYIGVETEMTQARIEFYNVTTNTVLSEYVRAYHVGFEKYVFNVSMPASGTIQIRLGLENYNASGYKARFDLISMKEISTVSETVANISFETVNPGDATMPANWTRSAGATASHIYRTSSLPDYYIGTKGIAVTSDGSTARIAEQTINYAAGTEYVLSYYGRVSNPNYSGRIEIFNVTDNQVVASSDFAGTRWARNKITFTSPSIAGKTVKVRLYQAQPSSQYTAYFDLVSVKKRVDFEPAAWERTVSLTHAHMTNSPSANAAGDWGMELIHDGTTTPALYQTIYNYKPNSPYSFSLFAKVLDGGTGSLRIFDVTNGTLIASQTFANSDIFRTTTLHFTTPAAGRQIRAEITMSTGSSGSRVVGYNAVVGQRWDHQVQDGHVAGAILRFVNAVYKDSSLHASYMAKADSYRNFIADNLFHKWDTYWRQITGTDGSDNGTGVYTFPTGFSTETFPGRSLPHNMNMAYARMLYLLYDATSGVAAYATDRPTYLSRANDLSRAFQTKLTPHNLNAALSTDALEWNYWDNMSTWDNGHYYVPNGDDLAHGATVLQGVMEAYRHGQVFSLTEMLKFARTFKDVLWNGSYTNPLLSYTINRQPQYPTDHERTFSFSHWVDLSEFDREVWEIADAICSQACPYTATSGIAKWSKNKLVNTGFETVSFVDSTLPMYWTRYLSSASTAYRDETAPFRDNSSATVKTVGNMWQIIEQRLEKYEPNTTYTVTFHGKTNGNVGGRAEAYDATAGVVRGYTTFTSTSWNTYSFTFRTPSVVTNTLKIRLYQSSYTPLNGTVEFDEVMALPDGSASQLANGGFESADYANSTLPRYWKRGPSTAAGNASINNTEASDGLQSAQLTTAADGAVQELYYEWKGYKPSGSYQLKFQGKTNGSTAGGLVKIIDTNTNTVLASSSTNNTSWSASTFNFTAPSAYDHTLKVVITHDNPSITEGTLWLDEIQLILN